MNFNFLKNFFVENIKGNYQKISFFSGILILYYNPALYFTIIGVGTTYCLYDNFIYNLDISFNMKKKLLVENNNCEENIDDLLDKSFLSDKTTISEEDDMKKSKMF